MVIGFVFSTHLDASLHILPYVSIQAMEKLSIMYDCETTQYLQGLNRCDKRRPMELLMRGSNRPSNHCWRTRITGFCLFCLGDDLIGIKILGIGKKRGIGLA